MDTFNNQVVMITGGSKGIGLAVALRLGSLGAKISICGRSSEALAQAEAQLKSHGINAISAQCDVANESDVDHWFQQTEAHLGEASILVNNAGIAGDGLCKDLTEDQWDKTMNVNVRGVFLCTKRALPAMMKRKDGRIVMISSIASQYFRPTHSLYFASKWALNGFSYSLAKEVSGHNIRVKIICPGMTETCFFEAQGGRPHDEALHYIAPETIAEQVEQACLEPDGVESMKRAIFPSWQIDRQFKRR